MRVAGVCVYSVCGCGLAQSFKPTIDKLKWNIILKFYNIVPASAGYLYWYLENYCVGWTWTEIIAFVSKIYFRQWRKSTIISYFVFTWLSVYVYDILRLILKWMFLWLVSTVKVNIPLSVWIWKTQINFDLELVLLCGSELLWDPCQPSLSPLLYIIEHPEHNSWLFVIKWQ